MPDGERLALHHRYRPPGLPKECRSRPRVTRTMLELLDTYGVAAVMAGPGTGKTVQAQLCAQALSMPLAWLTVDRAHHSAPRLIFDLANALRTVAPRAVDTVRRSHESDGTTEEAAALLASSCAGTPCALVIDECQNLDAAEPWLALDTFLEYVPDTMRVVLVSRSPLPWPLDKRLVHGRIGFVSAEDLNLTPEETADYLAALGAGPELAARIHESTGGWMAGVAFAARFGLPDDGASGADAKTLTRYLDSQVLDQLPADELDFLLDTCILDAVTPDAAVALHGPNAYRAWLAVAGRHLPAMTVTSDAITYHSLLRLTLRERLLTTRPESHDELVRRHAGYLAREGRHEEASELLAAIGRLDEAMAAVTRALPELYERADWPVVMRWLDRLGERRVSSEPLLLGAWIRALHGSRQYDRAFNLITRLHRDGRLRAALMADPSLLAIAAWSLQSDPRSALALLDEYEADDRAAAVRFMITSLTAAGPARVPRGDRWHEAERLLSWGLLVQGRLGELARLVPIDDDLVLLNPNPVLAAAFRNDESAALRLWQRVPAEIRERPHSRFIEAVTHLTCGQDLSAVPLLKAAVSDSHRSGFALAEVYELFAAHVESVHGDTDRALDDLETLLDSLSRSGQAAYVEWAQCFIGIARLRRGEPGAAQLILEEAVTAMSRAQRRLFLPLAAAAKSEASALVGDDDGARQSAALAYHVAQLAGNVSALLWAVRLFPNVRHREMARDASDVRWRRLIAVPSARANLRGLDQEAQRGTVLALQPFGRDRHLTLDGERVPIGRLKIFELVACLTRHPEGVDRFQLQQMLFPETDSRNGGNHFRQITHKLRQATGVALERRGQLVLAQPDVVTRSADVECERLISSASALVGPERIDQLQQALAVMTGPYLWDSTLWWAEEQRNHLAIVREEATLELARLLVERREWDEARRMCETVLERNRYSDPAYRILVGVERVAGSETSALAVFQRAQLALSELGLRPGEVRRLIDQGVGAEIGPPARRTARAGQ